MGLWNLHCGYLQFSNNQAQKKIYIPNHEFYTPNHEFYTGVCFPLLDKSNFGKCHFFL